MADDTFNEEVTVSIIMPAFNAAKYIDESIRSVVRQTYRNWELIIIDDGSTDNTKEIVRWYISKDKRIKYLWQPNGRQGKARNNGLRSARGTYVAFLDADDIWLSKKLEMQLKEIAGHNVDLVFSDAYIFELLPLQLERKMNAGTGYFKGDEGIVKMLEINRIPILTVLVKKDVVKKVNGFPEKLEIQNNEDYHLWLKLLFNGYVFYGSPEVYSAYRKNPYSASSSDKLSTKQTIETLYDLMNLYPSYKQLIRKYLKVWFTRYYYAKNNWDKNDFKNLIKQNCAYLNRSSCAKPLYLLYRLSGLRVSRKVLTTFINR